MTNSTFQHSEQAVQTHLGILQAVIERMSTNSGSAKAWCITLVSAILVIVADKNKPNLVWLTLIPTLLFLVLDAYYLALEKGFRASYRKFVEKLHRKTLEESDFYSVEPSGQFSGLFFKALVSLSVWPLYTTLILMTYIAQRLVR
jgi:hypothetical protein